MKKQLDRIRKPEINIKLSTKIINSALILLLGIALGCFSKGLDNLSINDAIWWQHILGILDLRNVFSGFSVWICIAVAISVMSKSPLRASLNVFVFFVGMTTSYHLYSILFSGFNPLSYMMIWYIITLFTPILAYICWYGKGKGILSLIISIGILAIMLFLTLFARIGSTAINVILFLGTFGVLYTDKKKTIYNLIGAVVIAILVYGFQYF